MFRSYSFIIFAICVKTIVFASSKRKQASCGENEIMSPCINRVCEYRRCSDIGGPIECMMTDSKRCKKGCICIEGYLRADDDRCIPANQCPHASKCPKENEYYDRCPPQCPSRTCTGMVNVTCPEPLQAGDPKCPPPACRCEVGYYRDIFGNCVTWNMCKNCPENERPTSCIQGRCERRDCADLPNPVICVDIDPNFCTPGCLCEEGLLRAANETCIPETECPQAQCGDNEVFDICPPICPGEQCGIDPSVILCLPNPEPGDPSCQPRCRCSSGFLRNNKGRCVPESQCQRRLPIPTPRPMRPPKRPIKPPPYRVAADVPVDAAADVPGDAPPDAAADVPGDAPPDAAADVPSDTAADAPAYST